MRNFLLAALAVTLLPTVVLADRLDDMVSPAIHVVNFEDPRTITEARFLYVNHQIQNEFVTTGGDVEVYALQLRAKLTDRLSFIATKDGIVNFNPSGVLPKKTGLADVEAGFKYVLHEDRVAGEVFSAQLRYLFPVGDEDVLQGEGNGMLHPSVSGAYAITDELTVTSGTGLRIPMDSESSFFWDVDAQIDYRIDTCYGKWYPLVGASLIHVVDAGNRLPIADEGQDFFNFGASDSTGENMVLGAAGLKFRPIDSIDIGATYQFPFDKQTGNRVLDYRWMFDVSFRF
jgi:hypothetical protein